MIERNDFLTMRSSYSIYFPVSDLLITYLLNNIVCGRTTIGLLPADLYMPFNLYTWVYEKCSSYNCVENQIVRVKTYSPLLIYFLTLTHCNVL